MRNSGIDIIGDVPWGTHFCQFYQTKEDLMDILVPYFKAGMENNEFCMWVTLQPLDLEEAKEALQKAMPDIDVYIEKGQIEIIPYTNWFVKEGVFDSDRVLNGWVEKLNQALANGYDGLRLTGNTFGLEKADWNDFVNYEKEVDRVLGNYQMIALCIYCLDKCNAKEIIDVVVNHQFALIKREGKWERIESSKRREAEETAILQSIERKKAEQERVQADKELRESDRRYHLLFKNMLGGFAYCRMLYDDCGNPVDFIYLDTNSAFEQLTGLKEVTGKRVTEVIPGIKEQHPELFDAYSRVALTGQPDRFEIEFKPLGIWLSVSVYSTEREHFVAVFDNITERKRADEALSEAYEKIQIQSEELQVSNEELRVQQDELNEANALLHDRVTGFRTLAENSPDLIARFDRQNHCLYANPAIKLFYDIPLVAEFYGLSAKELANKTSREVQIDPEMIKLSGKQRDNVFTTGEPEAMELHYTSPQGKEYYFDTKVVPEFVEGKVVCVLVLSRDITTIKEAEAKLNETLGNLEEKVNERTNELEMAYISVKENEDRYHSLFDNMTQGLILYETILDSEGNLKDLRYVEINDVFEEMMGVQRNKIIGDTLVNLFPKTDPAFLESVAKTVSTRQPQLIEWHGGMFDRWFEALSYITRPGYVGVVFQEITGRKITEQKIQALANTVESSNDSIITESLDGIIASWNKGAEQVYGYLAEEVLGKNMNIFEPDNLKGEIKQLADDIKQGKKIQHYATSRLKKDGAIINVSETLSPVFDTSGNLVAISYIASDITETKIAEKLLQEKQMAEVANRTKSEFLASMSHELRTPLNSIIGFSDMLYDLAYGELNKKQLRSVGNISKSGNHLLNLINSILDISKIEAGKMELDYKNFELANKLNMVRNIIFPIADRKNIKIEIDMDSKLTSICVDEDKFVQIMYNFVDNAIKFSYENSLVKIRARKKGDMVEITVKDTGIGIKVEDQYKLFKPFSQIDSFSSRKYQGTGLGLTLVKQIVHLHGGYVWFRSDPSEGSTFAFAIPINNNKGNSESVDLVRNA